MNKSELLKAIAPRVQSEKVEGVGEVFFREMSAAEFTEFQDKGESFGPEDNNLANIKRMALFLVLTITDEAGTRMFEDMDADEFTEKPFHLLTRLFEAGMKVNGMGDEKN